MIICDSCHSHEAKTLNVKVTLDADDAFAECSFEANGHLCRVCLDEIRYGCEIDVQRSLPFLPHSISNFTFVTKST